MADKKPTHKEIRRAMEADRRDYTDVTVCGLPAQLQSLSAYEAEHYHRLNASDKPEDQALAMAKLLQMSLVDMAGNLLYTRDEVKLLAGLKDRMLRPLYYQALQFNGLSTASLLDMAKNLLKIAGVSGDSDSPASSDAASTSSAIDTPNGS